MYYSKMNTTEYYRIHQATIQVEFLDLDNTTLFCTPASPFYLPTPFPVLV